MTWIAFDTETTGLQAGSRMVELAAIAFADDGSVQDTFTSLVHPGMPIPADATAANGVTDVLVADAPDARTVLGRFLAWLPRDGVMIAHNARYDQGIVSWECQRAGLPLPTNQVVDSMAMARQLHDAANLKLQTLVLHHGITVTGDAHRALPDTDALRQYFQIARRRATPVPSSWVAPYAFTATLPDHLVDLPQSIAEGRAIRFNYRNRSGKPSRPLIVPYGWADLGAGRVMLHGHCTWACERRLYDVSQVTP